MPADYQQVEDGRGTYRSPLDVTYQLSVTPVTAVSLVVVDQYTLLAIPTVPPAAPGQPVISIFADQTGCLFTPSQLIIRGYRVPRKKGLRDDLVHGRVLVHPVRACSACTELVAAR